MHKRYARAIIVLCVVSDILYNDWFLGYVLNKPEVRIGLTSDLEAYGQPYNWLFITTDVLTGLCLFILVVLIAIKLSPVLHLTAKSTLSIGLLLFSLFTTVSALLPLKCTGHIESCGAQLSQTFGLHDFTGGVASLGMFIGLIGLVNLSSKHEISPKMKQLSWAALYIWSLAGILFLSLTLANKYTLIMQQIFLILSGLATIVVGLVVNDVTKKAAHSTI